MKSRIARREGCLGDSGNIPHAIEVCEIIFPGSLYCHLLDSLELDSRIQAPFISKQRGPLHGEASVGRWPLTPTIPAS